MMRLREFALLLCLVPFVWNGGDDKKASKPQAGVKEVRYKLDVERLLKTVQPRFAKLPPNAQPMVQKMIKAIKKMKMKLRLRHTPKRIAFLSSKVVNPFTKKTKHKEEELVWEMEKGKIVIYPPKKREGKKSLFCKKDGENLDCYDVKGNPQLYFLRVRE